jgi:hypothetical protein
MNTSLKVVGMVAILSIAASAVYYFAFFLPQEQDQVQYDACMAAYNSESGTEALEQEYVSEIANLNTSTAAITENIQTNEYNAASANCKEEFPRADSSTNTD